MAVSYLSRTIENNPYIAPLDLNVMAKVLAYKQGTFDTKAQQIQNQIDTIGSLDVLKDEDRQYLNEKLNGIVSKLNDFGGVDLADPNISGQIEGFATSIYGDNNVTNAIGSTKKARSLMASYDKMKTDPKLIKYYSEANERDDLEKIQNWMGDGKVGSSYQGPSVATRYYDYDGDMKKAFQNVVANKQVELTAQGFYISKVTKETYTPEQIMSAARDMLTVNQQQQMMRDGKFMYKYRLGYGKDAMVGKALEAKTAEVEAERSKLAYLKGSLALEQDPKSRTAMTAAIKKSEEHVSALEATIPQAKNLYESLFDNNPDELMYMTYSNDYFRGLGTRYQIYKEDRDIKGDEVKMLEYKENAANVRQDKTIQAAKELQKQKDDAEMQRLMLQGKIKKGGAGSNGVVDDGTGFIMPNTATGDTDDYTAAAQARLSAIDSDIFKAHDDYLASLYAQSPGLKNQMKDWNNDGKTTIQDLFAITPEGFDAYATLNLPTEEMNIVKGALVAFTNLSSGSPVAISKLPKGTFELVEKLRFYDEEKKAVAEAIDKAKSGDDEFLRGQFLQKTYNVDTESQNDAEISQLKNTIIQSTGSESDPGEITVLGVGKKTDGSDGYEVYYKEKGKSMSKVALQPQVAAAVGVTEGPYSVVNKFVTKGRDFYMPIQNNHDSQFVSNIRVYKDGNNSRYNVQYGKYNPITNSVDYVGNDMSKDGFSSAAQAYEFGKKFIYNFGADLQDKTNLKTAFELKLETINK